MERNLKAEALLERVAQLTQQYENQIADLRVSLTQQSQQLHEQQLRIEELEVLVPKDNEDIQDEEIPTNRA